MGRGRVWNVRTPSLVERIDFAPGGVPQKMAKKATEEERKMCGGVGGVGGLCEVAQPLGGGRKALDEKGYKGFKHIDHRGLRSACKILGAANS